MNLSSLLFHHRLSSPEPLRNLTRMELNDIARLEQAVALHRTMLKALLSIGEVDTRIAYAPVDSATQIYWEIEQLQESVCEIRRQPELEAERRNKRQLDDDSASSVTRA